MAKLALDESRRIVGGVLLGLEVQGLYDEATLRSRRGELGTRGLELRDDDSRRGDPTKPTGNRVHGLVSDETLNMQKYQGS